MRVIVYQLACLNPAVKQTYVGQTYCMVNREHAHSADSEYGLSKLYRCIRENGGWTNWEMRVLGTYKCKSNLDHADRLEWFWWKRLGARLNSLTPGRGVPSRDMRHLKVTESALLEQYEKLEECIHCDYMGTSPPPKFSKKREVRLEEPEHTSFTGTITGFFMSRDGFSEVFEGHCVAPLTRSKALTKMRQSHEGKRMLLFMSEHGPPDAWDLKEVPFEIDIDDLDSRSVASDE